MLVRETEWLKKIDKMTENNIMVDMCKQILRKSDERMGLEYMPRSPTTASTGSTGPQDGTWLMEKNFGSTPDSLRSVHHET